MPVPTFEIFLGYFDKEALWLEAVRGLRAASARMKEGRGVSRPIFCFLHQNTISTRFDRYIGAGRATGHETGVGLTRLH